jgi:hypothetical protein
MARVPWIHSRLSSDRRNDLIPRRTMDEKQLEMSPEDGLGLSVLRR